MISGRNLIPKISLSIAALSFFRVRKGRLVTLCATMRLSRCSRLLSTTLVVAYGVTADCSTIWFEGSFQLDFLPAVAELL